MKIGIHTIHNAHNYGSVLQAFAMQCMLKSLGHEVEIINYKPKCLNSYKLADPISFKSINSFIKSSCFLVLNTLCRWKHYWGFKRFMKSYFIYSGKPFNDINKFPINYDAYVMGSDQIWNPDIMKYDKSYWGEFNHRKGTKIISYAASMEAKPLSADDKMRYKTWLQNFDYISVRERDLIKILQPLTNKEINTVIDPTLMITKDYYDKIASTTNYREKYGKYILVYCVISTDEITLLSNKISKERNAKIITIKAFPAFNRHENKYYLNNVTPSDFLALIRDADCVIATSFHGTVFSLIYHKDYYTIKLPYQESRITNLLRDLSLENRMVSDINNYLQSNIDYDIVENRLIALRKASYIFLNNALQ